MFCFGFYFGFGMISSFPWYWVYCVVVKSDKNRKEADDFDSMFDLSLREDEIFPQNFLELGKLYFVSVFGF